MNAHDEVPEGDVSDSVVYAVCFRECTECRIDGVFTTRNKAKEYLGTFYPDNDGGGRVRKLRLNPKEEAIRDRLRAFGVLMERDGEVGKVLVYGPPRRPSDCAFDPLFGAGAFFGIVNATSEERAIEIVNEQRLQYLATEET